MSGWFVVVESNTTGTGRLFCKAAREMGLRPIMLARDPGRYPYVDQDGIDSRVVDTASVATVLDACRELDGPIAGVTSSSEYFIATAAEVAGALELPHADHEAIRACRDKGRQRVRLRAGGVPTPGFATVRTPDEAVDAAERIGLPVVVKPVAGSGSIATRLCRDTMRVRRAAAGVLDGAPGLPPQDAALVEEYLDGPEYSVETMDDRVVGITRKYLGPAPYFLEIGHDFPAPLDTGDEEALRAAALEALRALGLGWGPAHVELRLTAAGPRIVEVNPRLAGGMIPRLVEEALGIDLIEHVVAAAAGRARTPEPARNAAASIRFVVADRSGRLAAIHGVDAAKAVPGVVEVAFTRSVGQDIVISHSFTDRLGAVIASAPDGSVAASAADKGALAISAEITSVPVRGATPGPPRSL
jgi:S-sulfo-L-cysteine synthase (3-phospho-L-serine-dependent)